MASINTAARPNRLVRADCFAADTLKGLSMRPKRIPSMYLYDARGSELFRKITELEEYYLTDCELEILHGHGDEIAGMLPKGPFNLVELGAGDGRKTAVLMDYLLKAGHEFEYMPVDISDEAMRRLTGLCREKFGGCGVKVNGLVAEYLDALGWIAANKSRRNFVLFLGSSIGNHDREAAHGFLRRLRGALNHGDLLLVGFDLKKDITVIERAYDDAAGLTREFNLNLLRRINRELGGEFDTGKFLFQSFYDPRSGAVESHLVSTAAQKVWIEALGRSFQFEPWEGLHTESSHKFLVPEIQRMAFQARFKVEKNLFDGREYFVDSLWRVIKGEKPGGKQ